METIQTAEEHALTLLDKELFFVLVYVNKPVSVRIYAFHMGPHGQTHIELLICIDRRPHVSVCYPILTLTYALTILVIMKFL